MPKIRSLTTLIAAASAITLTACTTTTSQPTTADSTTPTASSIATIKIGTGITPETRHAAYIYAAALNQQGYTTEVTDTGSTRDQSFKAMGIDPTSTTTANPTATAPAQDHVHIVPDLSGDLLLYLTDNGAVSPTRIEENRAAARATATATDSTQPTADPSPSPSPGLNLRGLTSSDIVGYVDRALPDTVQLLNPSNATNRYGYVITTATATKHGISSMDDLEASCSKLSFTAPDTYRTNPSGATSHANDYNCQPTIIDTNDNRTDTANKLITGQADIAYLYSTSTEINQHRLTLLEDPKGTQLAQNIVPLTRTGELPTDAIDAINSVSARLDTDALIQLNALTSGSDPISETDAANFWLSTTKE